MSDQISHLLALLTTSASDRSTLEVLLNVAADPDRWPEARGVFDRIRLKTIEAERTGDQILLAQYRFEEACAKTFYNMSRSPAPFDPSSPYWIIPNALIAARRLGLDTQQIIDIVTQ